MTLILKKNRIVLSINAYIGFLLVLISLLLFYPNKIAAQNDILKLHLIPFYSQTKFPVDSLLQHNLMYVQELAENNERIVREELQKADNPSSKLILNLILAKIIFQQNKPDLAFDWLIEAVNIAESPTYTDSLKGAAFAAFGEYLFKYNAYEEAIQYLSKAKPFLLNKKVNNKPYYPFSVDGTLLNCYYAIGDSIQIIKTRNNYLESVKFYGIQKQLASAYNNCSIFAHENGDFDVANTLFEKALQTCQKFDRTDTLILTLNIKESYAHTLMKLGNSELAFDYLKEVYDVRKKKKFSAFPRVMNYLIKYNLEFNNPKQAFYIYQDGLAVLIKNGKEIKDYPILLNNCIQVLLQNKKVQAAAILTNHYNEYLINQFKINEETLRRRYKLDAFVANKMKAYRSKFEIEELKNKALLIEIRSRNLFIFFIILSTIVSITVMLYILNIKRQIRESKIAAHEQAKKILELKNNQLNYELILKEKDISKLAADNKLRTSIKKTLLRKLKKLESLSGEKLHKELVYISNELDQAIDNQDQLSLLQDNVHKINFAFEEKLKNRIPEITQQEIKVCSLLNLGMDNHQIAQLLNKSNSTIRTYQQRIRQKAGIKTNIELLDIIQK